MEVAILYFVVLLAAFYLLVVRPQRRRAMQHRGFVAALEVGDDVITNGGIFGTIRALDDEAVDLEVASGVIMKVARVAISQPVPPDLPPAAPDGTDGPPEITGPGDGDKA
jgi:preprotein translocase subunit YajC